MSYQAPYSPYNNSQSKPPQKKSGMNGKIVALASIGILSVGALAGGFVYLTSRNTAKTDTTVASNQSSSSIVSSDVNQSSPEFSSSSSFQIPQPTNFNTAPGALSQEEIQKQRLESFEFVAKGYTFDPQKLVNETFSAEQVSSVRSVFGNDANALSVAKGKKVTLSISYSSMGDRAFEKATLYVKLSNGLKLVPGSISDTYNAGEKLSVADSMFSAKDNLLVYGPGTSNKDGGPMKIGDRGVLTLTVEIDPNASGGLGVASYIKDENGKIGQPAVFFIDPTN